MTRFLAAAACLACAALAHAQLRTLPADAARGQVRHLQEMIVEIDGRPARLAQGAQVRDAHNRILLPMAIPPGSPARYRVNAQGEVSTLWLLSEDEARQ